MQAKSEEERWAWWRGLFIGLAVLDLVAATVFAVVEWRLVGHVAWTVFAGLGVRLALWGGLAAWAHGRAGRATPPQPSV